MALSRSIHDVVADLREACDTLTKGGVIPPPSLARALAIAERKAIEEPGALLVAREACRKGWLLAVRAYGKAEDLADTAGLSDLASAAADILGYRVLPNPAIDAVFAAAEDTFAADGGEDLDLYSPQWPQLFVDSLSRRGFKIVQAWGDA